MQNPYDQNQQQYYNDPQQPTPYDQQQYNNQGYNSQGGY